MFRLIYVLMLIFKIWMVVDAVQRKAEIHWYLIILFLPFGEFVYFFMNKFQR